MLLLGVGGELGAGLHVLDVGAELLGVLLTAPVTSTGTHCHQQPHLTPPLEVTMMAGQQAAAPSQVTVAVGSDTQSLSCADNRVTVKQQRHVQQRHVHLEQLPGGGRGVHTLIVVIIHDVAHEVICRGGEHPGLEPGPRGVTCHMSSHHETCLPVRHVAHVVEVEVVLLVHGTARGVLPHPPAVEGVNKTSGHF